ncbi:hypothetical protein B0H14DRAFT_3139002 [Mycena olivaceomarginata]|nr:hypothetical protein B0H14DRAFT_3139002 [Mycena olivaceomarginata]
MAKGQFDRPQNDHIESFFPEFAKELDRGIDGAQLTKWKQAKASSIMESPRIYQPGPKKESKEGMMIVRKFTNYRNQVYRKSATVIPTPALANRKANPLLKFSSITSGLYQNILKERWDSLSGEDQWTGTSVQRKRQEILHSGLIGDAEMVLWYSFREVGNDDLMAGRLTIGTTKHYIGIVTVPVQDAWTDGRTDNRPVPSLNSCLPSMPYRRRTAVKTAVPSTGRRKDGRMGRTIMIVFTGGSGWITVDVPAPHQG